MDLFTKLKSERSVKLVVVACFLQLVGYVTPGWYIVKKRYASMLTVARTTSYSVWYVVICNSDSACRTKSLTNTGKISIT